MPRHPDPDLEDRILNAAQSLWRKGAEEALTMRAVAEAAGTNTPALYRRFRNRDHILQALLRRVQKDVSEVMGPCRSPEEACHKYLEYALGHPHEYELFYEYAHQLRLLNKRDTPNLRESRPTMALMEDKLANRLGGAPSDHTRLSLALWTVSHGTAMVLISKAIPSHLASELRAAFAAAVETLITNANGLNA
ncbi:MAG TPA: TetR/AcrR family transcriptional regulator [Terriglobales bacterium]